MKVQVSEQHIGLFASGNVARSIIDALVTKGWPVAYGAGEWQFDTLAQYKAFMWDFELAEDALMPPGGYSVEWLCDCPSELTKCPHGLPAVPPESGKAAVDLGDLHGAELRAAVEKAYPGLARRIEADVDSLYGALAWGLEYEQATGDQSAAGLWLRRRLRNVKKWQTYDEALADFADLVDRAHDDAWLSEWLAKRGLTIGDVQACPTCGGWPVFDDCKCKGSPIEES